MLEEVDGGGLERNSPMDVGFAPRFLRERMEPSVERVLDAAGMLARRPEHVDPLVETIVSAIGNRAERLRAGVPS